MFPEAIGARLKAGQEALARSAVKEAVANLQNGIELLSKLPLSPERFQAELALQSNLAMAYTALAGWAGPRGRQAIRPRTGIVPKLWHGSRKVDCAVGSIDC